MASLSGLFPAEEKMRREETAGGTTGDRRSGDEEESAGYIYSQEEGDVTDETSTRTETTRDTEEGEES